MDAVPRSLHPIRLVVTDDCERSRLTVVFRALLAIPHLLWLLLWGAAAFTAGFVVWLAVLVERRAPRPLHGFIASYVRYAAHVTAYLTLAASPYPGFTGQPGYPVDVEIDPPATQGRWGAGFRLLLAVPALGLSTAISGGPTGSVGSGLAWYAGAGGLASVAAFLGWFVCIVRGRMPRGLRDVAAYATGYAAQTCGYLLLLTDRYPSSDPTRAGTSELPDHPVRVTVTDTLHRARSLVFFRFLLALPHLVWVVLWTIAVVIVSFPAWVIALVTGRVPLPLWRFLAAYVRYRAHLDAFLYVVGGPFPGFVGAPGSYPVDVTTDPPGRQRRLLTLFRAALALPALLLSSAYVGVLLVIAVLGWFASLATGRMPGGMRDLGAAGIRYNAQMSAFLLLVTDRYPYSAPFLGGTERPDQLTLDLTPDLTPGLEHA